MNDPSSIVNKGTDIEKEIRDAKLVKNFYIWKDYGANAVDIDYVPSHEEEYSKIHGGKETEWNPYQLIP